MKRGLRGSTRPPVPCPPNRFKEARSAGNRGIYGVSKPGFWVFRYAGCLEEKQLMIIGHFFQLSGNVSDNRRFNRFISCVTAFSMAVASS